MLDGYNLLLHNLSHSDMVLSGYVVSENSGNEVKEESEAIEVTVRPKFSHYRSISERVLKKLITSIHDNEHPPQISTLHPYNRESNEYEKNVNISSGFHFHEKYHIFIDYATASSQLTFAQNFNLKENQKVVVKSIYFPLIAILLSKWLKVINEFAKVTKVLILVSGRGTPSDTSASVVDNSTRYLGKIIGYFVGMAFPDICTDLLHSTTNLFRYDENIIFVKQELLPLIDSYRDELFRVKGADWTDFMTLCLSFADGSSARINAMSASLKYYKPTYIHFWQIKTFWRKMQICEDDVEWHTFEEIATEPAIALKGAESQFDTQTKLVVNEMQKFRSEFTKKLVENSGDDLGTFWLRKTKKPVLAVLLVQKDNEEPKLYRGTNMEVSMPTGSLCAERNVIGSALADDITLKRQDIKLIAVYSAKLPTATKDLEDSFNDDLAENSVIDVTSKKVGDTPGLSRVPSSSSMNSTSLHKSKSKIIHIAAPETTNRLGKLLIDQSPPISQTSEISVGSPAAGAKRKMMRHFSTSVVGYILSML